MVIYSITSNSVCIICNNIHIACNNISITSNNISIICSNICIICYTVYIISNNINIICNNISYYVPYNIILITVYMQHLLYSSLYIVSSEIFSKCYINPYFSDNLVLALARLVSFAAVISRNSSTKGMLSCRLSISATSFIVTVSSWSFFFNVAVSFTV